MADKIEWHPNGTPGPWAYETGPSLSGRYHTVYPNDDVGGLMICECYEGSEIQQETNARAIAEVPAMVQGYRQFPDRADFGHSDDYANAVDVWYSDYAKPILARIDGEANNAPL